MTTGEPVSLPLDRVLRLLAAEAGTLSDLAARAGAALASALEGASRPATSRLLRDAQALDELEQRVAGLRTYLEGLARAAPGNVLLDVSGPAAVLTLAAQAERLSGRGEMAVASADLDLF